MSLYYMLQKRPILWTKDARSACRNTQYCGQAMQDRLRNVAFWLDLRMICDARYNQLTNTWSKWSLATKDRRWLLTDEVWPIGQYLKSFLHQKKYTNLFPNHIKSTICQRYLFSMWLPTWLFGHITHGFEVTIAKWSVAASGQIAKRLGFEMGNCFARRTSRILR